MGYMCSKHKMIMKIVKEKDLDQLKKLPNGIEGVAKTLETDIKSGIPDDKKKIGRQRARFGSNTYKKPHSEGLFLAIWRSLQAFAILNDLVNILAAFILLLAASIFGQFSRPSFKSKVRNSSENQIEVLRGNKRKKISMYEIVVGDVVFLKIGDEVPADGLLVEGNNLQVEDGDQSGETVQVDPDNNPFLFSGSIVVNSDYSECKMMVTTVGMKAKWCEMMSQQNCDSSENSTMQDRVRNLTLPIRLKVGLPIASIGFLVFLIRYFTGNTKDSNGDQEFNHGHLSNFWDSSLLDFVGTAFTIVAVTIADSLRLSVPVTSFYSKKRMMGDVEMVSELSGCENMAFVTTICTNITGTLTMNQMKVNQFWVGKYSFEVEAYLSNASNCFKILLGEGIALNTSSARNCTPTDKAILSWAVHDLKIDMGVKSKCTVLNHSAFDSQKKRRVILMKRKEEVDNTGQHVHWKGEAEVILEMCSRYYDISGTINDLVDAQKVEFQRIIQGMKESGLHCISFAHNYVTDGNHETLKEDGLVLLALVGMKYPCRPNMKEAVKDCQNAGVDVKMITGDNVFTATDIARECGILVDTDGNGVVITGEEFRGYSLNRRMDEVDKIRVMACSSPEDKLLMVKTLKKKDHIVAVSGYSTNDVLALLEAHIGISMGNRGTDEVGMKNFGMVILDGNFASVAKILRSSIHIYDNILKLVQFELTLNLAALAVFFLSAVSAGEIPLNSTLVLWLNLIINTLASMALGTEKPSDGTEKKSIKRQHVGKEEPLMSNVMWRNLLGQVVYQIFVVLTLLFKAKSILGFEAKMANLTDAKDIKEMKAYFIKERNTLIFNAFLLCQVFNEFNARNLESIENVFKGIHKDIAFLVFIGITISVQVVFVKFFWFQDKDGYFVMLELWQWGICFGFAVISWPIDWIVKCIPVPKNRL